LCDGPSTIRSVFHPFINGSGRLDHCAAGYSSARLFSISY
jgi:hypothetical protein